MPLYVVATPIGNPEDITLRAQRILDEAEVVIGEEAKPTRRLLKSVGISPQKPIELLNEHSKTENLPELVELCREKLVALISDCGTPGFCDPGADLVSACYETGIQVNSCPGPASITTMLSLSGHRFDSFWFEGFLPAKTEDREKRLKELARHSHPIILMDTPYRLKKTLENCQQHFGDRALILGLNLSQESEQVLRGRPAQVLRKLEVEKAEFVLAVI